jgi:general stress protein YciG
MSNKPAHQRAAGSKGSAASLREYLAKIGAKGGKASRREITPEQQAAMQEARKAKRAANAKGQNAEAIAGRSVRTLQAQARASKARVCPVNE